MKLIPWEQACFNEATKGSLSLPSPSQAQFLRYLDKFSIEGIDHEREEQSIPKKEEEVPRIENDALV